jgi:hypothetical protein
MKNQSDRSKKSASEDIAKLTSDGSNLSITPMQIRAMRSAVAALAFKNPIADSMQKSLQSTTNTEKFEDGMLSLSFMCMAQLINTFNAKFAEEQEKEAK